MGEKNEEMFFSPFFPKNHEKLRNFDFFLDSFFNLP